MLVDRLLGRKKEKLFNFGSVDDQLQSIINWQKHNKGFSGSMMAINSPENEYLSRAETYLSFAKELGLDGEAIVHSCYDLAASLTSDPYIRAENRRKINIWERISKSNLAESRGTRTIEMNLDPIYFYSILNQKKSFEGRAYDPNSIKNYPNIRSGDIIIFALTNRKFEHFEECERMGLREGMKMQVDVGRIFFSPLVHWMYEFNPPSGKDFQPNIDGPSEILQLQSAAVYYMFPGYPQKINDNGFVGIEVLNPKCL